MKLILAATISIFHVVPVFAQIQPNEQTSQLVATVTDAFFSQLVQEDFDSELGFLSTELALSLDEDGWRTQRQMVIARSGPTPTFIPHRLTYYQQDTLLAAVDYSGQIGTSDTYICGYVLWTLPTPNTIGVTRFEQNIVDKAVFLQMGSQEAADLMVQWQCPPNLIATVLGLSLQ